MRPDRRFIKGVTALASGLLLVSGVQPWVFAGERPSSLQVSSVKLAGELLEVTLLNSAKGQMTGKVILEVRMRNGERTLVMLPFVVSGGQKVFVTWASPNPVDNVHQVGIIVDDGAPI
jgi:hypothetical protein